VISDPRDERLFGKDLDRAADRRLGFVEWEPFFMIDGEFWRSERRGDAQRSGPGQ